VVGAEAGVQRPRVRVLALFFVDEREDLVRHAAAGGGVAALEEDQRVEWLGWRVAAALVALQTVIGTGRGFGALREDASDRRRDGGGQKPATSRVGIHVTHKYASDSQALAEKPA
jgi:hypothetical protein